MVDTIRGERGPQGKRGDKGPPGPPGGKGDRGDQGPAGAGIQAPADFAAVTDLAAYGSGSGATQVFAAVPSSAFDVGSSACAVGKRVLVPSGTGVGVYLMAAGSDGTHWNLSRATDLASDAQCGTRSILVTSGSKYAGSWQQTGTTLSALGYQKTGMTAVQFTGKDLWHNTCPFSPTANYNYGGLLLLPFSELRFETNASQIVITRSVGAVAYAGQESMAVCIDGVWTDYVNNVANPLVISTANANATRRVIIRNGPGEAKAALIGNQNPTIAHNQIQSLQANGDVTILPPVRPANRLVVVGDSITCGYASDSHARHSWTMLLRDAYDGAMAVSVYGGAGMSLMGAGGNTAAGRIQLAKNIVACLDGAVSNTIWLEFGINDILVISGTAWVSAAAWAAAYGDLLDQIRILAPSVTIYAQSPILQTTDTGNPAWRSALSAVVALRTSVIYIDGSTRIVSALSGDGTHPSTAGYYTYFQCAASVLGLFDLSQLSAPKLTWSARSSRVVYNGSNQSTLIKNGAGDGNDLAQAAAANALVFSATSGPNGNPQFTSTQASAQRNVSGIISPSLSLPLTAIWIGKMPTAIASPNQYIFDGLAENQHAFFVNGSDQVQVYAGAGPVTCWNRDGNAHVMEWQHTDSTHSTVLKDGTAVATAQNAGGGIPTGITLGSDQAAANCSTANHYDGGIFGTLNSADHAWLKYYALARYGITTAY